MHYRHSDRHCEHRRARGPFGRGGHGPDHDHGGRHRGGRRLGRVFDHGDLRFVVLALIAEKPRHGYEIIKAIEESVGGSYSPSPGVIYPTLTMLEELGHATVTESGGKKLYAATAEGIAHLAANQATVDSVLGRMKEISAAHGGGPAPQIVRAIENLKLALRLRQSRGPLDEEQIRSIAAALDAAAVAIERS
jgi:DNA-binding PadR family transcriptional regulator